MTASRSNEIVSQTDIACILHALADMMSTFRQQDLALQDALSSVAAMTQSAPQLNSLQHIDLITQTHADLARFLPELAAALAGENVRPHDLRASLTLRSLQDQLLDPEHDANNDALEPGDLALF